MNPCGPDWLHERIKASEVVVIDGAMGTELEARGVPMHGTAWSGAALLTHRDVVRATHADYIAAGAEVIITNTFASGRHSLEPAGLGEEVVQINRSAVEAAREAREEAAERPGPVAIAGSMCEWSAPEGLWSDTDRLSDAYREHADLLAESGVDIITLEMCSHPVKTPLIVEAAVATGLPVWLGLSCKRDNDTSRLVGYDPPHADFAGYVEEVSGSAVGIINVMHTAIGNTAGGLALVKRHWSGPTGVYPESGHFTMPNWQFVDIIEPDALVEEARGWVADGAQIIGGCCGTGVPHVRALKAAFG